MNHQNHQNHQNQQLSALNLKYPRGFSIFFLTEMWERYGFYVVQTLLIFYLIDNLKFNDNLAYITVGSFTALSYINCIFGGIIADRLLGNRISIVLGGVLLAIGYYLLGLHLNIIYIHIALAIISVGTGLLKPNISTLLGTLYLHNNKQYRDIGYVLFYIGIYFGAISGSLVGSYIKETNSWDYAFYSATIGSILAVATFIFGVYKFNLIDKHHHTLNYKKIITSIISTTVLIFIAYLVLQSETLAYTYFIFIAIFCLIFILICIVKHHGTQKKHLWIFLLFILLSIGYWGIYFQQFFSISLSVARLCNINFPASSLPAVESLGVIIFGPIVSIIWQLWQKSHTELSFGIKFCLGFVFNSIAFLLIALGLVYANFTHSYLNVAIIIIAYLIIALGELHLSPTSLSMVNILVPERLQSVMMGISLLSIGFGGKLAGILAHDSIVSNSMNSLSINTNIYLHSFIMYFVISLALSIVSIMLIKYTKMTPTATTI